MCSGHGGEDIRESSVLRAPAKRRKKKNTTDLSTDNKAVVLSKIHKFDTRA